MLSARAKRHLLDAQMAYGFPPARERRAENIGSYAASPIGCKALSISPRVTPGAKRSMK